MLFYACLAFLPIAVLVVTAVFSKKGIISAALAALAVLSAIALLWWQMPVALIAASAIKGLCVALEIGSIVLGAVFLFEYFSAAGGEAAARSVFKKISSDRVVQAVIVAWAFVHFIEGVSGFGTPAMIAAPILIALGFNPITSVVMCLIGDSVPVIFGAVGLPVIYGFGSIVGTEMAARVGVMIGFMNVIASFFTVFAIAFLAHKDADKTRGSFRRYIPLVIVSSLAVSLPALITVLLAGAELPSVIGGLCGIFVIFVMRRRISPRVEVDRGDLKPIVRHMKPFIPYIITVGLLAVTRLPIVRDILSGVSFDIEGIFGQGIGHHFAPLYAAGPIFITVSLIFILFSLPGKRSVIFRSSFRRVWKPLAALSLILVLVQIFINSGNNAAGLSSMPQALIMPLVGLPGGWWPFFAPFVGAFGAFIAGGATVSNLLMTPLQVQAASMMGLSLPTILTLQGLGAAGGNMIAIHNVLAALAVVGAAANSEKKIIRSNLPFVLAYLVFLGISGIVMSLIFR